MDTDVLVVGAGPTGLMLANQLARRGVRARIVDRNSGPAKETRAIGVQARTLEIYAHLGVLERAFELGTRGTGANVWSLGRRAVWIPFSDVGRGVSAYPYVFFLGQDDNEKILGEKLRENGLSVDWSHELVGIVQETDRVIATLRGPDGATRDVAARWVAGCDGARSAVREMSRIEFVGAPYEHVFYVADTQLRGPMVPDEVNVYLWVGGFHLFFPMKGKDHWRVIGILPASLQGRDDVTLDDVFPSIRGQAGAALELQACSWFSTYRIHHRRAARFRDRRCFLLGDAAHVHSPVGAQGMNTGLQDAYNLGWKLALCASGAASDALLDTYESERIPVAVRLLDTTDRLFKFIVSEGPLSGSLRTRVVPKVIAFAMRFDWIRKLAFRTISQTGIRYPDSRLSETLPDLVAGPGPRAGDRFPWLNVHLTPGGPVEDIYGRLDDRRFSLVVFGQPAPAEIVPADGMVDVVAVPDSAANESELDAAKIPRPSFYLVRPDGHIGLCGARVEPAAVARYLADRVGIA